MMKHDISKELLHYYYTKSFPSLKTGMDKITATHFEKIKNEEFDIIVNKINNEKYKFTRLKEIKTYSNRKVYMPTIRDRLVLDYLKDKLNSKFKLRYQNRQLIIRNIMNTLSNDTDYFILRLDLKNFFPSIPQNKLLEKIKNSMILTSKDYYLTKELLKQSPSGLPQGVSISNPLAEVYLEEIDNKLKKIDQRLNLYSRYVDDIVIIFNGNIPKFERTNIYQKAEKIIKDFNLELNKEKMNNIENQNPYSFKFLGYHFKRTNTNNNKKDLEISIAQDKERDRQ